MERTSEIKGRAIPLVPSAGSPAVHSTVRMLQRLLSVKQHEQACLKPTRQHSSAKSSERRVQGCSPLAREPKAPKTTAS